jgi:hypothetical protein
MSGRIGRQIGPHFLFPVIRMDRQLRAPYTNEAFHASTLNGCDVEAWPLRSIHGNVLIKEGL